MNLTSALSRRRHIPPNEPREMSKTSNHLADLHGTERIGPSRFAEGIPWSSRSWGIAVERHPTAAAAVVVAAAAVAVVVAAVAVRGESESR